jgi:hypothetical protein
MPVTKDTDAATWNFSWRQRPKGWVDDPITVTDEDGNVYNLSLVANSDGAIINPADITSIHDAQTETNSLLEDIKFLLQSIAEK